MTSQRNTPSTVGRLILTIGLGGLVTLGAGACTVNIGSGQEGSGVAETVAYDFDDFDRLDVSDNFDVEVSIEDGPPTVEITVDDNLTDELDVRVDDGVLRIGWRSGSRDVRVPPTGVVTVPQLKGLDVSGAGRASVDGVESTGFAIDISGASLAELNGTIDRLVIDGSGASDLRIRGAVDEVVLDLSGAASADLTGAEIGRVELDLSGASHADFDRLSSATGQLSGGSALSVPNGADISVETAGASSIDRG